MTVDTFEVTSGGVEAFTTADFHDWRRHVSESFVPLEVRTDRPDQFLGQLRAKRIDRLAMFDIRVSQHSVIRTPELVALSGQDYYMRGSQLPSVAARWTKKITGMPPFGPSSRFA